MGFSRVYLAVHWPGDVAGGWALGAAFALAMWAAFVAPREREAASTAEARADAAEADARADAREDAAEAARDPSTPVAGSPRIRVVLFDWGNTLMVDDGQPGPMAAWPRVAAVPGAAEALAALHGHCRLCVATNADDSGAREVMAALGRVGLARHIARVFSSRDVGARKPAPAFYAAVLDALRADAAARGEPELLADQVVMVGDNWENDVVGAWAAGFEAIWFDPARTRAELHADDSPGSSAASAGRPAALADLRELASLLGAVGS
jgi:FMN phosphatase YigB (HAD superfamily)